MKLHLDEFIEGISDYLSKRAEEHNIFDLGGSSIFPRIESQQRWRFARTPSALRLSDGHNVYVFHAPEGESHEADFPVIREDDLPHHQFEDGTDSKGTAQIHRADPGSIYFTLQDGRTNPTYTFKHTGGKSWKGIPKRRSKVANIIEEYFWLGVKEAGILDDATRFASNQIHDISSLSKAPGMNPMGAAAVGLGLGGLYDIGKRTLYNTPEENEEEGTVQRGLRYALPAAALGGIGAFQSEMIPNYYKYHPTFDPSYDDPSSIAPR